MFDTAPARLFIPTLFPQCPRIVSAVLNFNKVEIP
jgi:hypothetical protein